MNIEQSGRRSGLSLARVSIVLTTVLMMGGCASGSGDPSTAPTDSAVSAAGDAGAESHETPVSAGEPSAEPVVDNVYVSPIGEALGVAQDELAAAFETYVREAENLVRECMIDAGFEYTPTATGLDRATQRQFELQDSLTAEQFTQQYGFGISTLFELNFKDEGVLDFVNQQFGPPPTEQRSPGEQEAYELALNGESTQGLSAEEAQQQIFGGDVGSSLDGSCRSYGYDTAENPGAVYDGLVSILGDELDALVDRYDSDARVRAANAEWQTCMAAEGHAYDDRSEMVDELQTSVQDLANRFLSSTQVLTALGDAQQAGLIGMDADSRRAFLEDIGALQGFSWVPEVQADYDDLVAFELRVAADSKDCADEELFQQVRTELETEFVEAHADQLALIVAENS